VAASTYSPRLRTALMLCGAGTAGVYQAGVLRALTEAGVKVDLLAAHGAGVAIALGAAIDGGTRLWEPGGPWTSPRLAQAYRWRAALRVAALGLAVAGCALLSPLLVLAFAAATYVVSLFVALVDLPRAAASLVELYHESIVILFNPPVFPTMVPRAVVLALLVVFAVLVSAAVRAVQQEGVRRRARGAAWWRLVGAPLDSQEPAATLIEALWKLVRGASNEPRPAPGEIGRRYVDILTENFGQPGFREVLIAVHDVDARRDLVAAVLPADVRTAFMMRRKGPGPREADILDLTAGPQRELVVDLLAGALRLPIASAPHVVRFPAECYWRGESHRLCDRPELAVRLIDEIAALGIEQLILVNPAAPAGLPHGMRGKPIDLRGRMGEQLRSIETAALADAWTAAATRFSGVFVIRPDHNPVGPFDFTGAYDEASDRQRTPAELMQQGYEDAYAEFIEPVVASGEKVDATQGGA
jgi:hypothetical protein